jgi:hypothetical protein
MLIGTLFWLICEVILSSKKPLAALDNFELFYEEITKTKVLQNRVKRVRQVSANA